MQKTPMKSRTKDAIFCSLILLYPLIHFSIFYIYVNLSSFAMAFQYYKDGKYIFDWGQSNFELIKYYFKVDPIIITSLKNSAIMYLCAMLIGEPLSILFSYVVYKKVAGTKFFKIVLFMPTIISALVMSLIYKYFMDSAIPEIWYNITEKPIQGLFTNYKTVFEVVLFYNLFLGFGPKVLIYSSTMSGINESVVESAQLDGITFFKELWFITIPMIFPTITTYLVASVATFFTNQMGLFNFFGHDARTEVYTLGFYMYIKTQVASVNGTYAEFTYLSALGLLMSAIAIPATIGLKKALEKYGPRTD